MVALGLSPRPSPPPTVRTLSLADPSWLAEREERRRAESQAIEEHNLAVARERADRLVILIEAADMYRPERSARFESEMSLNAQDGSFFELVLDELRRR